MSNTAKNFDILIIALSVLHYYFDQVQQNYFFYLYSAKILHLSAVNF